MNDGCGQEKNCAKKLTKTGKRDKHINHVFSCHKHVNNQIKYSAVSPVNIYMIMMNSLVV